MACQHPLEAAYLYPSDVDVLEFYDEEDGVGIRFAFPCPECGHALETSVPIREIHESTLELPIEDVAE